MQVILQAPLTGWALPLSEVPDPVFSQGLAGPGYAIDPTVSVLKAPCAGEVVQLHRCLHALTVRRGDGLEVLMHVGIDTVKLNGQGFKPRVKVGDRVEAGAPLLEFDSDLIATRCRSLITVVVIPENPAVTGVDASQGKVLQGSDWLKVEVKQPDLAAPLYNAAEDTGKMPAEKIGRWLELPNPSGMHARPAARLLILVKDLPGNIYLEKRSGRASARSLVGILGLGLGPKEEVRLVHTHLSEEQLSRLEAEILGGLGDDLAAVPVVSAAPALTEALPGQLRGVVASRGLGIGTVYLWKRATFHLPEEAQGGAAELEEFEQALAEAARQISDLERKAPVSERSIFAAHAEILHDPQLLDETRKAIGAGQPAARAWHNAYDKQAELLAALSNPLLAARANDLRDVGERVLTCLLGESSAQRIFPEDCIVVCRDLNPSETVQLDRRRVKGLCLSQGGPTSHVAILARSLGIPSLCALGPACLELKEGVPVVLDAENGVLLCEPSEAELDSAGRRLEALQKQQEAERALAHQEARTGDGAHVEVAVNIGNGEDLRQGLEQGAEGVGLFRTEFYFHGLDQEPGLEQQVQFYGELAAQLGTEKRLVARLLDVGGDKPLPYVPMAHEENPFLGVRGIRLYKKRPELFRNQIQALLQISDQCRLAVMVPMISTLAEWRSIRAEIEQQLRGRRLELGVMIEVPSAALLADQLAPEVDFFSIGTNDLTQYTLAIDRAHPDLAGQVDALHPSILRLMHGVGEAARKHGKWVGVCGGAAQDLEAVPLLLGMNIRELSVSPPAVPSVKAEVRRWSVADCETLVGAALALADAEAVRKLVRERRK
ncbi:MAG: phosphoenolpyruvate--protein phosphotransferase [Candidatus Eremiobacteraeota bacterium]|nr:phosphoenolpyruvate--protein phosphotransferase [Candidatus Eremiobacteraeota bacterium]MCW5870474.1 phosphoenolpyruvate--protein phosphotransferase [Candidatus Eremiobacteraeota bacterium]